MKTQVVYRMAHFGQQFRRTGGPEVDLMGTGPYCVGNFADDLDMEYKLMKMCDKHNDDQMQWPAITDDLWSDDRDKWKLGKARGGVSAYYSCCDSIDGIIDWFGDDLDDLLEMGFRLIRYEVIDAIHVPSKTQSAIAPWAVLNSEDVTHEVEKLTLI